LQRIKVGNPGATMIDLLYLSVNNRWGMTDFSRFRNTHVHR